MMHFTSIEVLEQQQNWRGCSMISPPANDFKSNVAVHIPEWNTCQMTKQALNLSSERKSLCDKCHDHLHINIHSAQRNGNHSIT